MNPEESRPDVPEEGVSRRRMLKRIGAGAAVAWTAPILTSIRTPAFAQGCSLLPTMRGEQPSVRDALFTELTYHAAYDPQRAIRTERWKYFRWVGVEPAVEELYDLKADPLEEHNLAGRPEHRKTLAGLRERWKELREQLK